jgi:cell division protein FtsI (penicillin-binding protein 3)
VRQRIWTVLSLFLIAALALLSRAFWIQIVRDPRLVDLAKRQYQTRITLKPRRGVLYDRHGEPLAINTEILSLAVHPKKLKGNQAWVAQTLSKALKLDQKDIRKKLQAKKDFQWLKRHLTEEDHARLANMGLQDSKGQWIPGLALIQEAKRHYPHGELAAQVIGTVNRDGDGIEGLELAHQTMLAGKSLSVVTQKDALGRPTALDSESIAKLEDGEDLHLTLDATLQFEVESELKQAVLQHRARAGSVIVMDSMTGEIYAAASVPTFDPNSRSELPANRRNRLVTDGFEPGSIVKPLLLASALTHGMKLTDQIHGEKGSIVIQKHRIREAESHERFEMTSLKKMIQVSSNVVSAKLALRLGTDKVAGTLRSLGIGQKTGLHFPGEIAGILPSTKKPWQPLTLANIGFGHGLLVTPLQMARAYAAISNGGWLVEPTYVRDIQQKVRPKPVLAEAVTQKVVEALLSVTEQEGTGSKAVVEGFKVAGKTGTAQTIDPVTKKYSRDHYIATFVGFPVWDYPVKQYPRPVILTMIDGPRGKYYAGETAAPLFQKVLGAFVRRFAIPATEPVKMDRQDILARLETLPKEPTKNSAKGPEVEKDDLEDSLKWSNSLAVRQLKWEGTDEAGRQFWKMPEVRGLTAREALRALQGHRFQVSVHGEGVIQHQTPEPGEVLRDHSIISLRLGP